MPVPSLVTDLSATIASNSPAGSDNVFPDLDNYLRALSGFLASIRDNSGNGWVSPYLSAANPSYTGTLTGGTGVVNLGSGQFYKSATGDVGIGTTSPGFQLDIQGTGGNPFAVTRFTATAAAAPSLVLQRSRGATVGSNVIVQANDRLGTLAFIGANGTSFDVAAQINAEVDGTPGASADMPGRLVFLTSADGSATPTARMRIDSSGNVVVNGTTAVEKFTLNQGNYYAVRTGGAKLRLADQLNEVTFESVPVGVSSDAIFTTSALERMRLDQNGNLGLGVTPSAWSGAALQLQTNASLYGFSNTTNVGQNAYYNAGWKYMTTAAAALAQVGQGAHYWFTAPSGTAGAAISFTQAMTLDASGNLGIGTASPAAKLEVNGSIRGVVGTSTLEAIGAGDLTVNASNAAGQIALRTAGAERVRIDSSGSLLLKTTTSGSLASGGMIVNPTGDLSLGNVAAASGTAFCSFLRSNVVIGSITQNGTTGVLYNINSDIRLKNDIAPAPSASADIDAIQVVSHGWKSAPDEHVKYGVIAQDLAQVAPQAVKVGDAGDEVTSPWGVDYSKLVPMLIKEIQSLRARVAALETV